MHHEDMHLDYASMHIDILIMRLDYASCILIMHQLMLQHLFKCYEAQCPCCIFFTRMMCGVLLSKKVAPYGFELFHGVYLRFAKGFQGQLAGDGMHMPFRQLIYELVQEDQS